MNKRAVEIIGAISVVGGAFVGIHGVSSKRWQVARSVFVLSGAIAIAIARYREDGEALDEGSFE